MHLMLSQSPKRSQEVALLAEGVPKNAYGLPLGIYRMDLLPEDPTDEDLENAFTPLQYDEGFPTQIDGRPFWSQLTFEPIEASSSSKPILISPILLVLESVLSPRSLKMLLMRSLHS